MSETGKTQRLPVTAMLLAPLLLLLARAGQAQSFQPVQLAYGGPVRCESINNRTQQCALQGRARLVRQLSSTPCVQGENWGQARQGV